MQWCASAFSLVRFLLDAEAFPPLFPWPSPPNGTAQLCRERRRFGNVKGETKTQIHTIFGNFPGRRDPFLNKVFIIQERHFPTDNQELAFQNVKAVTRDILCFSKNSNNSHPDMQAISGTARDRIMIANVIGIHLELCVKMKTSTVIHQMVDNALQR